MAAQEANVSTISNNIANINTIGFKRQRVEFEDLMYQTTHEAGSRSSATTRYNIGVQIGSGAKVSATRKEFRPGSPKITNNPFDLMVSQGQGLFGILLPNGAIRFTRDGSFNVDHLGNIVDKSGYRLYPGFQLPPNVKSVNIGEDGTLEAYTPSGTEPVNLGQIPLFTFVNVAGLKSISGNLYRKTASSGEPIQNIPGQANAGTIMQGALETSNVSIMNEMSTLIKAQRSYEMNSKVMKAANEMLQAVNNSL